MIADGHPDVREDFLRRAGLSDPSVVEVVNAIKQIPHGRPRERSARGVVDDWRGTCSTKLLLLKEVCPELGIRFFNRVFRMTPDEADRHLGPEVAAIVPPEGLVDIHTYAQVALGGGWLTIDVTFPGEPWDGRSNMSLPWDEGDDFEGGR
jgi:hypothetical protein